MLATPCMRMRVRDLILGVWQPDLTTFVARRSLQQMPTVVASSCRGCSPDVMHGELPTAACAKPCSSCRSHCRKALQTARQLGDLALEAQACYSLGSAYMLLNECARALECHERHLQIAQELNDKLGQVWQFCDFVHSLSLLPVFPFALLTQPQVCIAALFSVLYSSAVVSRFL